MDIVNDTVYKIIVDVFERYLEDSSFEGTMSYFYEVMKDNLSVPNFTSREELLVHLLFSESILTDDDVNFLLEEYGDDEYFVCTNGELIEKGE